MKKFLSLIPLFVLVFAACSLAGTDPNQIVNDHFNPPAGDVAVVVPGGGEEPDVDDPDVDYLVCPADFAYTGEVVTVNLARGKYKLEVWGAEGGKSNHGLRGGYGAYSSGIVHLTKAKEVKIYIGGTPTSPNSGGFNGGGNGSTINMDSHAGGGASDIRIGSDSLYARVIVAGGGGASGCSSTIGGAGGGLLGLAGIDTLYPPPGLGGTQIGGGESGTNSFPAGFGFGGDTGTSQMWPGGGGGGGWYGGGAGSNLGGGGAAGGGGSGWIYTAETFAVWEAGNPADAAQWLLDSSYYLTNAETIAGNESFTAPDGSTETGHAGNGYARITKVE